jgi:hypothetical protein
LKPILSELRVQPGRLVGCRRLSGHPSLLGIGPELGYFIGPDQHSAGYLVRSFKSNDIFRTDCVVPFDSPETHQVIAARHALRPGVLCTGLLGASEVASDTLRLLRARSASGLSNNVDDLVVVIDKASGRPSSIEWAWPQLRPELLDTPQSAACRAPASIGVGLITWLKGLPPSTRVKFVPNPKRGSSAQRYEVYSRASTLSDYLSLNPDSRYVFGDLRFDCMRGYVRFLDLEVPTHIHAPPELAHVEPSMYSSLRHAYQHSIRGALNAAVFLDGVLSLKSADEFQSAQLLHGSLVEIVRLITPEAVAASASLKRWSIAAEDSTNLSRSLFDGAARSSSVDDFCASSDWFHPWASSRQASFCNSQR